MAICPSPNIPWHCWVSQFSGISLRIHKGNTILKHGHLRWTWKHWWWMDRHSAFLFSSDSHLLSGYKSSVYFLYLPWAPLSLFIVHTAALSCRASATSFICIKLSFLYNSVHLSAAKVFLTCNHAHIISFLWHHIVWHRLSLHELLWITIIPLLQIFFCIFLSSTMIK